MKKIVIIATVPDFIPVDENTKIDLKVANVFVDAEIKTMPSDEEIIDIITEHFTELLPEKQHKLFLPMLIKTQADGAIWFKSILK